MHRRNQRIIEVTPEPNSEPSVAIDMEWLLLTDPTQALRQLYKTINQLFYTYEQLRAGGRRTEYKRLDISLRVSRLITVAVSVDPPPQQKTDVRQWIRQRIEEVLA